jgi:predicted Rossmann fold nucleotide-binding protein DprA/Smf involved in DNA uptake
LTAWVTDKDAANADLVAKGGNWLKADIQAFTITDLVSSKENLVNQVSEPIGDLFSKYAQPELFAEADFKPAPKSESEKDVNGVESDRTVIELQADIGSGSEEAAESNTTQLEPIDFYQLFSFELQRLAENPLTVDELIESTKLHKSQLTEWLKRAVDDGVVKKLNRPVRYQVKNSE